MGSIILTAASEAWHNYTFGFDVVSTEDDADGSSGVLTKTNVLRSPTAQVSATLGDLAGATPSSGTARYYATDHLGSTRSAWDASKASVGEYEFTPYGGEYNHTGAALDSLAGAFTGKPWDDAANLFHFPYRQYSPAMARWTTKDPLGMVDGPNVYAYVSQNPLRYTDPLGLAEDCDAMKRKCAQVTLAAMGALASATIAIAACAICVVGCATLPFPANIACAATKCWQLCAKASVLLAAAVAASRYAQQVCDDAAKCQDGLDEDPC